MSVASPVGSPALRFFAWWGSELRGMLPGGNRARRQMPRIFVCMDDAGFRVLDINGGKSRPADAAAPGLLNRPEMLALIARRARSRAWRSVGLRVPYATCFARRVEVPAGAEPHAAKLLALDLMRNSPFRPADIRTAFYRDSARPPNGKVPMRQLIIKREAIDGLIADIEGLGIDVVRADCWSEDGTAALPVDFLEDDFQVPPARLRRAVQLTLALTALGLAGAAAYITVDRHEAALRKLQGETAALKSKAHASREALAKSQAQFTEYANLQKARSEYVSKPRIINELTRLMPDTAWVNDIRIEGATVDFTGLATSAAGLVQVLERSQMFVDATLTAPLTFDQREDKERFSMRVRLRNSGAAGGGQSAEVRK